MMRSLFSGVAGIKVHQTRMDVIGNNIANINTIGFKSSRTTFSDMLSQLQSSAAAPTDGLGGINAKQIGLGVNVESIDLIFTDSSPQQTGKNTDLALSGNGLFVLKNGNQSYYTRNGAFMFDESGYYVMPGSGLRVQGWNATDGAINTNGTPTDINVPVGKTMEATATTAIDYSGNLDKESLTITRIQPTKTSTGDLGEVTTHNYSTQVAITYTPSGGTETTINVTAATKTSYPTEEGSNNVNLKYGKVTTVTTGSGDDAVTTYTAEILDDEGNVLTTLTGLTGDRPVAGGTYTGATATAASSDGSYTSVNVDGTNALAAKITLSDGSTVNVTSGYYEVGKSIPVTTLATVYDSLGGVHEVTLLMDKSPTSTDDNLTDINAIATEKITYTYFDASGNSQTVVLPYGDTSISDDFTTDENTGDETYQYTKTYNLKKLSDTEYSFTDESGDTFTINRAGTDPNYTYSYTDKSGTPVTVEADDLDLDKLTYARTVNAIKGESGYDNRWRVYIAPGEGLKGPADSGYQNSYTITESDGSVTTGTMNNINYVYFDDRGQFISNGQRDLGSITFTYSNGNGAAEQDSNISFEGLTQYANNTTSFPITNGNAAGILQSLAIDGNGIISGTYTNGLVQKEGQIAVAQFSNSGGLTKVGTTIYQESNNSGSANIKTISDFGLSVISSALEMSNVDLANEFSDMIITQRGFQANSKVTTVSDEMLETLVNMKR